MTVKEFIAIMALNEGEVINIDLDFTNKDSKSYLVWELDDGRYTNDEEIGRYGDCEIVYTETSHDFYYSNGYEPYVERCDTTFTLYIDFDDRNIR